MDKAQPEQLMGLVFAVGLIIVGLIVMNFRVQLWTAVLWCVAVMRQAVAARAVLVVNVSGVNTFGDEEGLEEDQTTPDRQTDKTDRADRRGDNAVSVVQQEPPRFAVDKTRRAVLEELLTHGWTVTDLRREGILRGDNVAISAEVAEVRKSLGMEPPTEYRTPIAGRATAASFYEPDPELAYQPPD